MIFLKRLLLFVALLISTISANAISMKVGDTETLDIGNVSHLQGCQWTISRPNDVVFTTTPQSYSTRVTIKAVNAFPSTSPCVVQCKYYYLELDPTTGRYTYSRTGYKDWTIFVKENGTGGGSSDEGSVSLDPKEANIKVGSGCTVYAKGNYSGKLTWSVDCKGKIVSFTSTSNDHVWVYGESAGTTYLRATCSNGNQAVCKITVDPKSVTPGNDSDYEIVDLGLSVNWASKNLGAKTPEDIGDYYAWGETATKSYYDEDNSKTFKWDILNLGVKDDESEYYYNLPNEYDVAYKKLGKEWSIPTMTQLLELWSECSWIPMFECDLDPSKEFDYSKEKFRGCKIIGKNGNSIYLPVTGAYQNGLNPNFAGEGFYQSKSGDEREPKKWYWALAFEVPFRVRESLPYRSLGIAIRPVTKQKPTSIDNNICITKSTNNIIYNIYGQRVKEMRPGNVYIVNGKKIVY